MSQTMFLEAQSRIKGEMWEREPRQSAVNIPCMKLKWTIAYVCDECFCDWVKHSKHLFLVKDGTIHSFSPSCVVACIDQFRNSRTVFFYLKNHGNCILFDIYLGLKLLFYLLPLCTIVLKSIMVPSLLKLIIHALNVFSLLCNPEARMLA